VGRVGSGILGVAILIWLASACSGGGASPTSSTAPVHAIVTFEIAGGERFKLELTDASLVAHAQDLLAGKDVPSIPVGTIVRGDPGPNAPWSWHLDPASIEFADATIEVCDGVPSDVEAGDITSSQYCPWSATVVAVDAAP
jgi:hypothetical protein